MMTDYTYLNDLLNAYGLPIEKVRLTRNHEATPNGRHPYELWLKDRDVFEQYQSVQHPRRKFLKDGYVVSFVADPVGNTLFAGLYMVMDVREIDTADQSLAKEVRMTPGHLIHSMVKLPLMSDLEGLLTIDWGKGHRVGVQIASKRNKPIIACPQFGSSSYGDGFNLEDALRDARERASQTSVVRPGQAAFRTQLLNAYGSRCAVTGCGIKEVLEAAHIVPHSGIASDHVRNGLLLRADIHKLFDKGLIAIDSNSSTVLSDRLKQSQYRRLHGRKLRSPSGDNALPSAEALKLHRKTAGL